MLKEITHEAPLGTICRHLDDMLSTPFGAYIINYESPRGFVVLKFTMYDETSDHFDHLMHHKQVMTLNVRNDMLLCEIFLISLHGPMLSLFHWLPYTPSTHLEIFLKLL